MADSNVKTSDSSGWKPMLIDWIRLEQEETGGDNFLFWNEANAIESAQRIGSLDAKVREFYSESVNVAVESYLNDKGYLTPKARRDLLFRALGLFSDECGVLLEEYVKSAAELFIKKMRLGALVDKRDKPATLMIEVNEGKRILQETCDKMEAFYNNLSVTRKLIIEVNEAQRIRKEIQDKIAAFNNKLSVTRKQEQQITDMVSFNTNVRAGVKRETLRVVVEKMRYGVEGQRPLLVLPLEDALIGGRLWFFNVIRIILQKICVEAVMDRVSAFEVLKREIAENWKKEKQVKDRIVDYQRKHHARLSPGFVAEKDEDTNTIKGETSGEGEETIEEILAEWVLV